MKKRFHQINNLRNDMRRNASSNDRDTVGTGFNFDRFKHREFKIRKAHGKGFYTYQEYTCQEYFSEDGKMIQKFMEELRNKGFKQKQLEEITGLKQSYISRLSRGAKPSLETVILLAETFKVSTDKVLGRNSDEDIHNMDDCENIA